MPSDIDKMKVKRNVKGLVKALNDNRDVHTRIHAAEALGELRVEQAVEPLCQTLWDENDDVRQAAYQALTHFDTSAAKPLLDIMRSSSKPVSVLAIKLLGEWRDNRAVPFLINELKESSKKQMELAEFVGKIEMLNWTRAIQAIHAETAEESAQAEAQATESKQSAQKLQQAIQIHKTKVIEALVNIGDDRTVQALKDLLKSENEVLQGIVKQTLKALEETQITRAQDAARRTESESTVVDSRKGPLESNGEVLQDIVKQTSKTPEEPQITGAQDVAHWTEEEAWIESESMALDSSKEDYSNVLLSIKHLKMYFPIRRGVVKRVVGYVRAVDDVNFYIIRGETLGLVGESGCGKTTLGRCVVRAYKPTSGKIIYHETDQLTDDIKKLRVHIRHTEKTDGASTGHQIDFSKLNQHDLKAYRHEIQMIFQDPFSSLNPRMTVLDIVGEPLIIHNRAKGKALKDEVGDLLRRVGLRPEYMNRYPNAFSGGQRQRIGIARALALRPNLIVCDEPVSALDVSVQAQVVNLLQDLQVELGLTYLFIAHDLSVVQHISNRVAVMYLGRIVELADSVTLYQNPLHPYTEALLAAVPSTNPDVSREHIILTGDVPNPANPPSGCYFHPRCRYAKDICKQEQPEWREFDEHGVACHFAEELALTGVD
ncbi:MAG: dipeptide ABC transporter ATP-binding protein [Anaerolineae bacterium]|nr:dipeptide ABC transporter ATP-binding protein [Anaerolineae bacterium]